MRTLKRKLDKNQEGITGIETAIILIALIVVAAIFTYTALSAGLFSIQKSEAAVHSGLKEAQCTLKLRGDVIAIASTTGSSGIVAQLKFTVANILGGEAMDFTIPTDADNDGVADTGSGNVVVINYQDQSQTVDDLYWTIIKLGNADTDDLLEANERFEITIGGARGTGDLVDALATDLTVKTTFNLEILTPDGATLTIERTTPAWIDTIVSLH